MIRNTIIALTAAAALGVALAPAAQAKSSIDFNVNLGLGGYIGVGSPGYYPVYDDYAGYDDEECHYVKVKHAKKKNGKIHVWYTKKLVCY